MILVLKLLKFEIQSLFRSKWLIILGVFFFGMTEMLLYFASDSNQIMLSLMSIILLFIPLISLISTLIDFYNAKEFTEFLLAHPIQRSGLFLSRLFGQILSFSFIFIIAISTPFLIHSHLTATLLTNLSFLLLIGIILISIFSAISSLIATLFKDKIKGFGTIILLWLLLSLIYDGFIQILIVCFQDYPFEKTLIGLIVLNPIDLGRVFLLLRFDISALMGYTGAVLQSFFGTSIGQLFVMLFLFFWFVIPLFVGIHIFNRKDV